MRRIRAGLAAGAALAVLVGCAPVSPTVSGESPSPSASSAAAGPASLPPSLSTTPPDSQAVDESEADVVGTVVRFSSEQTSIDVTIAEDNPTVRDFLSLLPTETPFEEFSGREKIAYLSRELATEGSSGFDPQDGDLIYFVPWGNLGFYYNAEGIGYSDSTIHLGTYRASEQQLSLLESGPVTIGIVE